MGDKIDGPVFLSIRGKDPRDAFMEQFPMVKEPVQKGSGAEYKKNNNSWVFLVDRSTGKKAVLLSVNSIKWLSSDRVEVSGGAYWHSLRFDVGTYRLAKKENRWLVEDYEIKAFP